MDHRVINVHHGSQWESWLVVYQDGRIVYHTENDGHACMRHGTQPTDELIDLVEVAKLGERHWKKDLVQQVQAALAELQIIEGDES